MGNSEVHEEWRKMYEEHSSQLFLFARMHSRNEFEAEDILHDVFVKALEWIEDGRAVTAGWLYNKVRFVSIDYARRQDRRKLREEKFTADQLSDLFKNSDIFNADNKKAIEEGLSSLPADQKNVIILKIWSDLTFDEIAQTLEISPNTAASRYRYGLETLKKRLETFKSEMAK